MPNYDVCSKCIFEYYERHMKWPSNDQYKAIYRKTIHTSDVNASDLQRRLGKYWYRTSSGVSEFKACEKCYKGDPGIADMMEHFPDGWIISTKAEWIEKDLKKMCVVM